MNDLDKVLALIKKLGERLGYKIIECPQCEGSGIGFYAECGKCGGAGSIWFGSEESLEDDEAS